MNLLLVHTRRARHAMALIEAMVLASIADAAVLAAWWGVEQFVGLVKQACGVFLVVYGVFFTSVS